MEKFQEYINSNTARKQLLEARNVIAWRIHKNIFMTYNGREELYQMRWFSNTVLNKHNSHLNEHTLRLELMDTYEWIFGNYSKYTICSQDTVYQKLAMLKPHDFSRQYWGIIADELQKIEIKFHKRTLTQQEYEYFESTQGEEIMAKLQSEIEARINK